MFEREQYRNRCARLTLGQEKMEEIIAMTESAKKKGLNRPVRAIFIAAACVAALTATAMAAPAVQQLFTTFTITYRGPNTQTAFVVPTLTLEEREGRSILTVNGAESDVTDAFAQDGQYTFTQEQATITVKPDGWVEIIMPGDENSSPITYTFCLNEDAPVTSVGSIWVENIVKPEAEQQASYNVSVDDAGAVAIADFTPDE